MHACPRPRQATRTAPAARPPRDAAIPGALLAVAVAAWLGLSACGQPGGADRESIAPAIPDPARLVWLRQQMAAAGPDLALRDEGGMPVAENTELGLRVEFGARSVEIGPRAGADFRAELRIARVRRGSVERTLDAVAPRTVGSHRVEYAHPGVTEWYAHGGPGLEVGATLRDRLAGEGDLELQIDVVGLRPVGAGDRVRLIDDARQARLVVSDLFVEDARGVLVPARMESQGATIAIQVDDRGAEWPLVVDPIVWTEEAVIPAPGGVENFGWALDFAPDTYTLIVGVPGDETLAGAYTGTAHVFVRTGGVWTHQAQLDAPDAAAGDQFGLSVSVADEFAIVGAPGHDEPGAADAGAIYFFERRGSTWFYQQRFAGAAGDAFGNSVSMGLGSSAGAPYAVAGAPYADAGSAFNTGRAVVYWRDSAGWRWINTLQPFGLTDNERFGSSVGISNVGASGTPYLAIGAPGADVRPFGLPLQIDAGQIHFFRSPYDSAPTCRASSTVASEAMGGSALAFDGNTIAAGIPAFGLVRVFWECSFNSALSGPGGAPGDSFGSVVALVGSTVVVGAPRTDGIAGVDAGAVYLFDSTGVGYAFRERITPAWVAAGDLFGAALAGRSGMFAAGAPGPVGTSAGRVSIYVPRATNGTACGSGESCLSGFCTDGVCCESACAGACEACSIAAGAPSDGFCGPAARGSLCRSAGGACDGFAETCDGISTICPLDVVHAAGTPCRAAIGPCDAAELCNGVSALCPLDVLAPAGTVCRAPSDACDVAETCSGTTTACPADALAGPTTICRSPTGICDPAEFCSGASRTCPADALAPAGLTCRPSAGACDPAEACTGSSAACPADRFSPVTTVCRVASDACDQREWCDGTSAACPSDVLAPAGTTCRSAAGSCDVAEACTGSSAACPSDAFAGAGTSCRGAVGACDVPEACTGSTPSCPSDALVSSGTVCSTSAGPCDVAEACTGSTPSCPVDAFAGAGTSCRGAAGPCDLAEACTGSGAACPTDVLAGAGTTCRSAAGPCDVAEACTGSGAPCPSDAFAGAGTSCRGAAGACDVAEACDGAGAACPADGFVPDGSSCGDGLGCNGAETCAGGVCLSGPPQSCDDANVCTADACDEIEGCVHAPVADCCRDATDCADADPCTSDACEANRCVHRGACSDGGADGADTDVRPDASDGGQESTPSDAGSDADGGVAPGPRTAGCVCGAAREPTRPAAPLGVFFAFAVLAAVRRRRRIRRFAPRSRSIAPRMTPG